MDNATLTANYLSSASDNFLPYIVNPYNTTDKLKRLLHGRWNKSEFTFCLASVGHVPYSGPITMTYDDTEDGKNSGMKLIITHWNPRNQQWEITSRSCLGVDGVTDLEVQDPTHSSTHRIKQKDDEINQLKKETTRLNKVRETIQRRLRQIEDLKAEVEQQKEILKSQNLALERDLDATIKKVDTGKKENQDVKKFETEKKLRELEAELDDERYQRANALNSRKKLENNIKDLRQQAKLAVCVKEDAVKQLKRVQAQMNDNQTELDSLMMKCKPP